MQSLISIEQERESRKPDGGAWGGGGTKTRIGDWGLEPVSKRV